MQTNDAETAEQIAALDMVVPKLEKLEEMNDVERIAQVKTLENFSGDVRLKELGWLYEEQRSEFDALDFIGRLRLESGRALWGWEEFHSGVLAWLLDPKQNHGMGDRFLSGFLTCVGMQSIDHSADWSTASVQQEWCNEVDGQWGYLDILIVNERARSLCAIENKVFSSEHSEQLTRYRKALEERYCGYKKRHYIFLSPRGVRPYREEEQKYWVPASYATVLKIVQQIVEDKDNPAKEDVRAFLSQYATTLRRNIVPDTNTNIREMVRTIYSEHKEAIDLIVQYKPDYIAEMKEMFRATIKQQPKWKLDWEGVREIVFFRSADWDSFEVFKTGTGWGNPGSLVTFGFDLRENCPTLIFTLGPGSDEHVREKIHRSANRVRGELRDSFTRLDVKGPILDDSAVDNWMDEEATRAKIEAWVKNFAENEFPAMNDVIVKCLEEYEAEQNGG